MTKRSLMSLGSPRPTRGLFAVHAPAKWPARFRRGLFVLLLAAVDPLICRGGEVLQTPTGLAVGDQFRFVFVTDGTTDATSTDISTYNAFVTAQAGGATYNGVTISWQAIGSTANNNAVDDIGTSSAAVYLASGIEVASSTDANAGGLWSGSLLNPIDQDLMGNTLSEAVWTGTAKSDPFGHTSVDPLGGSGGLAKPGASGATDSTWIASTLYGDDYTNQYGMYGISQVFTVAASTVPEPSSVALLGLGAIGAALGAHRRSRRTAV